MVRLNTILAGAAVYAGAAYGTYTFFASKPKCGGGCCGSSSSDQGGQSGGQTSGAAAFDRLAPAYDAAVGAEEAAMGYGWLRWWLLRRAAGDVLEVGAGTGRNLKHYNWGALKSLTLADASAPMLAVAEAKYFDDLRLNAKHPHLRVRFLLADTESMVASGGADGGSPSGGSSGSGKGVGNDGGAPREVPLRAALRAAEAAAAAAGHQQQQQQEEGASLQQQQQQPQQQPESSFGRLLRRPKRGSSSSGGSGSDSSLSRVSTSSTSSSTHPPPPQQQQQQQVEQKQQQQQQPLSKFAPRSFDAVVGTFGLCSVRDPVAALRAAAALLKPGGALLLLEHGRSHYSWLNERMDAAAAAHFEKWGCWWNRDIAAIVAEAGLDVESLRRWHLGTTYAVVARAPPARSDGGGRRR